MLGERFAGMIDVVILGSEKAGRGLAFPEHGGAVYVSATNRGKALGIARIALAEGRIEGMTGDEIVLSRSYPEDEEIATLVDSFQRNLNELMKEFAVANARKRSSPDGQYFVGVENCRGCHLPEFRIWQDTPHAHAFQTLVAAGSEALPECYGCHVTGHGDPAGYHPSVEDAEQLVNVQCEVCHDKGSLHSRDGRYGKTRLMNSCGDCHDSSNSPDFDPRTYWLMIEH